MVILRMTKDYLGTHGDVYNLHIANIEEPTRGNVKIMISEYQAQQLAKLFTHHETSGQFNENEKWS